MEKTLQMAEKEAHQIVGNWTTGAALTGWIPGSAFFLTAADTAMIHQVANAYDVNAFDMNHLVSTLSGAVGSAVAGGLISEVVGIIPLVGWAVKSAAMAGKARVIGAAVIQYFHAQSQLPDGRLLIPIEGERESRLSRPEAPSKPATSIAIADEED